MSNDLSAVKEYAKAVAERGQALAQDGERADELAVKAFELKNEIFNGSSEAIDEFAKLLDSNDLFVQVGAASHLAEIPRYSFRCIEMLERIRDMENGGYASMEAMVGLIHAKKFSSS